MSSEEITIDPPTTITDNDKSGNHPMTATATTTAGSMAADEVEVEHSHLHPPSHSHSHAQRHLPVVHPPQEQEQEQHNMHLLPNPCPVQEHGQQLQQQQHHQQLPQEEDSEDVEEKVKKTRQSFTMKQKIAFIMEYKQLCENHDDGSGGAGGERAKKMKFKAWLKEKNEREGTSLAYGTVYKWYKRFNEMEGMDESKRSLKKVRQRPFHELEAILVEVLRVRNRILHSKGLPLSDTNFIKSRAEMLYKDLYGKHSDEMKEFKCSNGWVCRFKERNKHIYDPERQNHDDGEEIIGGGGRSSTRTSNLNGSPPSTTKHPQVIDNQGGGNGEYVTPPSPYQFQINALP